MPADAAVDASFDVPIDEANGLDGATVIVTGSASGIGRATARLLASKGAVLELADVDTEGLETLASRLSKDGAEIRTHQVDVRRAEEVEAFVEAAIGTHGRIDGAVNAAGVLGPIGPMHELDEDAFDAVLDTNLKGTWLCLRAELARMLEQGHGSIVNVASTAGMRSFRGASAYAASKHGVLGLTRTAAVETARAGVRVNAVCPGVVDTPMTRGSLDEAGSTLEDLAQDHPIGRIAKPEEVSQAIAWLLSEDASFVTGSALTVDGGLTAL